MSVTRVFLDAERIGAWLPCRLGICQHRRHKEVMPIAQPPTPRSAMQEAGATNDSGMPRLSAGRPETEQYEDRHTTSRRPSRSTTEYAEAPTR